MQTKGATLQHCIVNILGNLLPVIFGVLYYWLVAPEWKGWGVFYGEGQFYLYGATLLTAAGYVFFTYSGLVTDRYSILTLIAAGVLIFVSVFYAWRLSGQLINERVLFWTSVVPFIVSLPAFYLATRLSQEFPDPVRHKRDKIDQWMKAKNKKKPVDDMMKTLPKG